MSANVIIPLIATIAYIPLFVILLTNRPWQPKHRLFLLFLIPTLLWSLSIFLFRYDGSDYLIENRLHLIRIGICLLIWMLVQLHYFIRSFYQTERIRIPLAYLFLVAAILLAATGVPGFVSLASGGAPDYGPLIIPIFAIFLATVGVKDIYSLVQKYRLSPNPAERNQFVYLIAAIAILTVFIVSYLTPQGEGFPVGHIGNFLVACVFTYAVVKHRLADVRVVFRQAIVNVVLYGGGLAIVYALVAFAVQRQPGYDANRSQLLVVLAVIIFIVIPIILFLVHKVRDLWQKKVEQAFIGARYSYRRQLSQFITRIHDVTSLEELGSEFISLIAQSFDCKRACLLLPQAADEGFGTRFTYPPVIDNPMGELKLRPDSPILTWLERENTMLPERNLAIFPEFQSMWADEREEIQSAEIKMFVPLMNKGKLVAILAMSDRRDGRLYTVEDIDLLEFISGRVATIMAKEYSHEQLREQDKETTLVNRLTAIITSSMSIQMIFDGFAQELKNEDMDIDWATIALLDGDELYFMALSSNIGSAWQTGERIPLKGTATERSYQEQQAEYEDDLKRVRKFSTSESLLQQGIRSVAYPCMSRAGLLAT